MINTHPVLKVKKRLRMVLDNDDLWTEILLRLPAKSVSRFKSVCKKWLSIISSDQFCYQHTLRGPKVQPSLILEVNHREFFYFHPTTNAEKKMIPYSGGALLRDCMILQACNGLMLLQFLDGVKEYLSNEGHYYIYNLTTRRSRKIALARNDEYPRFAEIGLAFDPSKSPYYKIVCIYNENPCANKLTNYQLTNYQIEVYDSESHSWKLSLEASSVPQLYSGTGTGTHWNNKIYWWSWRGYCCFDIDKNEMKTLSFPETVRPIPSLLESNGPLYHHCVDYQQESVAVQVWELVGNHDGPPPPWLLKHQALITDMCNTKILRFMAGSDTCSLLTRWGSKLRVYSFRDQTHEDLIDFTTQPCRQPKDRCFPLASFQFGETLVLV